MLLQPAVRAFPLVAIIVVLATSSLVAQPIAPEFQVNSIVASTQGSPAIAMTPDGDFVATWLSAHVTGGVTVHRRFASPTAALGPDSLVSLLSQAFSPAIAMGDSHYVVVWTKRFGAVDTVKVQVFDNAGAPVDTVRTIANAAAPDVAMKPSGDFIVVFERPDSLDGLLSNILAQPFSITGGPPSPLIPVNTFLPGSQKLPSIAMDGVGNFVVVWQSDGQDGDQFGVYGRRYDQWGNAISGEFQVNTYTTLDQDRPDVTRTDTGEFAVVWESSGQDGSSDGIYCRYYDAIGDTVTAEIQVNQFTVDMQNDAACAFDGHGNLIVSWTSEAQDGDVSGVFARRFGPTGLPIDNEFQVNIQTILYQFDSDVAAADDGSFVVVWQSFFGDGDGQGVFGRHYDASILSSVPGASSAGALLSQNVPNPFNPTTTIRYTLSREGSVELTVYDVKGRHVVTLISGRRPGGINLAGWDGCDTGGTAVSSGVYFYRLRANGRTLTRKMVLLK